MHRHVAERAVMKVRNLRKIEELTDEVKDSIDQLNDIATTKRRLEAARELTEYIQLHFLDYPYGS
jgi:hypothetical protein